MKLSGTQLSGQTRKGPLNGHQRGLANVFVTGNIKAIVEIEEGVTMHGKYTASVASTSSTEQKSAADESPSQNGWRRGSRFSVGHLRTPSSSRGGVEYIENRGWSPVFGD